MNAQHLQHKHAKRIERLRRRLHQVAVIQEDGEGHVELVSPTPELSGRALRIAGAIIRNTSDLDSFGIQLKVQPAIH